MPSRHRRLIRKFRREGIMMERDFEERLIELIKMKYRNNEFEGEIPFHWTEDDTVEYMISKLRLRKAYCSAGRQGSLKRDEEETPLWAQKLMASLETVEKTVIPAIIAMNKKNRERAEKEARFYDSLHTDEERGLHSKRTAYPEPKKYPLEPEKYPYAEGEEAKADSRPGNQEDEFERMTRENNENPKIRHQDDEVEEPEPEMDTGKEEPFHDYTSDNMTTSPKDTTRKPKGPSATQLARTVLQGLSEAQRKDLVREFMKRKYHGGNEDE